MGFKIKGATVAVMVAAVGAAMAVKTIVTDENVKENFNEAKEGFINSSKELVYATGAMFNEAVATIKKEVKDITDEVNEELDKEESGLDAGVTFGDEMATEVEAEAEVEKDEQEKENSSSSSSRISSNWSNCGSKSS